MHVELLQWNPFHCGKQENEKADKMAKEGVRAEQPDFQVTLKQKRSNKKTQNSPVKLDIFKHIDLANVNTGQWQH